ncbi:MAG: tRNA pseudouridine(38-40) synthase TruA [Bacilli bacterium]
MRYLLCISYNGNSFYGSQKQDNLFTVLGCLNDKINILFQENIKLIASSRTDKGVHAINQYVHFDSNKVYNEDKLKNDINKSINKNIYVRSVSTVNNAFHCRYNVECKEYVYIINTGKYNPFDKDICLEYNKTISKKLVKKFCKLMSGEHSFKSFTTGKYSNYTRDIKVSYKYKNDYLYIYVLSDGFYRYMVRNIIGLLLSINENKIDIEDIDNIFKSECRDKLFKTANPCGLYLKNIYFKEETWHLLK